MSMTNTAENLHDIASSILKKAKDHFDHVEVCAFLGDEQHIKIIDQNVEENLTSKSASLGIRLIKNQKEIISSTSDLNSPTIERLIDTASQNITHLPQDTTNFVNPDFDQTIKNDLDLVDTTTWPTIDDQIKQASELENLCLSSPDITKSNGSYLSFSKSHYLHLNSLGFSGSYDKNHCYKTIGLVSGLDQNMQQHYESSSKIHIHDLQKNQPLSQKAISETIQKLNPGTIASGAYPIIFDPKMAAQLIGSFLGAINGLSIIRKTSFLQNMLGQEIFHPLISITDSAILKRGLASKPFDADGFQTGSIDLVEKGILKNWLLDYKSAKQLNMKPTKNASRSTASSPSPSSTNVTIENGNSSLDDLMSDIKTGLYITGMMGMGVNPATGDLSQGANGFLIENGKITTPISGFTIAGNLKNIFKTMQPANDLEFERRINSPSIFVPEMMVAST